MPIDPGLGGWSGYAPVPVDPILGGQRPYIPPVSQPITTPGIDIGSATSYRGYYYEIAQNLAGGWLWAVYEGTTVSWGLSGVLIGGGTSSTQAEALAQGKGIINGLTDDPDYVAPPIQDDASVELIGVPEFELVSSPPGVMPTTPNGNGGGNGNGNGNGNGEPWFENFELVGLVAIIAAVMMLKRQVK